MQVELCARGQWLSTASSCQPASKFGQPWVYIVPKAKQGIIGISWFRVRCLLSRTLCLPRHRPHLGRRALIRLQSPVACLHGEMERSFAPPRSDERTGDTSRD
jgi:hypothetical protein